MLELNPDNALDFLRQHGWIGPGPADVEPLGWGVSNAVLRIVTPERTFVLKQSRPQLRTRDAWFSDLERVYREQEVMQALHPLLPVPTVPEVLFVDRPNYVFAMSHAPADSRVWKETLLAGEVEQAVGQRAGMILGRMHEATARQPADFERFRDHAVFVQLRVEPFYRKVQERRPEVAGAIEPIIERMLSVHEALCHGDYSPKNILVHDQGFTLVDYETAHQGDPTMDLGFFLSHLLLKAVKRHGQRQEFFELTRSFWKAYRPEVRFLPAAELERRGLEHCAVCLLARIDGTSPVDYLPEEPKREAVRRLGRRLLEDKPARWEEVLAVCESELALLEKPAAETGPTAPAAAFLVDPANQEIVDRKSDSHDPYPSWLGFTLRLVRKQMHWWWLVAAWLGLVMSVPGYLAWQEWRELTEHGVSVDAPLVERWTQETRFEEPEYWAKYGYEVETADGMESFTLERQVSAAEYKGLSKRSTTPVEYSTRDPTVARFADGPLEPPVLALVTVELWALALLFVLVWLVMRSRRTHRLLRDGRLLPGKLIESRRPRRGSPRVSLRYHFLTPEENSVFGKVWTKTEPGQPLLPGTRLTVLYLNEGNYLVL